MKMNWLDKLGNGIAHTYYWALWYAGFKDDDENYSTIEGREMITFMLRRQKERMKVVWWLASLGTLAWTEATIIVSHRWYLIPVLAFLVWLFIHVLYAYELPESYKRITQRRITNRRK
jgi:fatty acid desaturase